MVLVLLLSKVVGFQKNAALVMEESSDFVGRFVGD